MAIGPLMDLKQIYYFLSVADNGSFSRASEKLYIAQTALSRQIRMLEESLDIELFIRHGRGVVLTQAGELPLPDLGYDLVRNGAQRGCGDLDAIQILDLGGDIPIAHAQTVHR